MKVIAAVSASLALGVGGTFASAATITQGTSKYGVEFATAKVAAASTHTQNLVIDNTTGLPKFTTVALQADDVVTVTLAGASFSTSTSVDAILWCDANSNGTKDAGEDITAAESAATAQTYAFDISAGKSCAAGKDIYLETADLLSSSLRTAGNTLTLSVGATRNGVSIDTTAAPVTVATTVREIDAYTISRWNGAVNHKLNSKVWQNASSGALEETDAFTLTVVNEDIVGATDSAGVTDDALTVTFTGDFSFLDDTGNGCNAADAIADGSDDAVLKPVDDAAGAVTAIEMPDCNTLRVTFTDAQAFLQAADAGEGTVVFTFDMDNIANNVYTSVGYIIPQTISAAVTMKYKVNGEVAISSYSPSVAPGAWTSGASTVFVPYMPSGAGFSQVLYLTNNSSATGSVTVTGRDQNGVACSSTQMGGPIAVGANRVVNLGGAISAGLANCWGGANTTNKFFLTIQTNLPDGSVEVYSAFNAGGSDRGTVINSSNGRPPAEGGMGDSNSTARQ